MYYQYGSEYDKQRKFALSKRDCIGKLDDDGSLIPNGNFHKYFPLAKLPGEKARTSRSGCLRIGAYVIVKWLAEQCSLQPVLRKIFNGADHGLLQDLVAYSIVCVNNAAQYYPDYAYNHPLFTIGMCQYSDTKVSSFLGGMPREKTLAFLAAWNQGRSKGEKIYVSYDSTNKNSQAGDLRLVEYGRAKDDLRLPVFNYSIAYDRTNRVPLFYEDYPGSVVDVSQIQYMVDKASGYGYQDIGFILDRGYFSKNNIKYMRGKGYDFILMLKGLSSLVDQLVMSLKGSFEQRRDCAIREFRAYGTTVKSKLFADDDCETFFHIFHSARREAVELEEIEAKIERMSRYIKKFEGRETAFAEEYSRYFELFFDKKGRKFLFAREKPGVIEHGLSLCGYFAIVSSEEMTASEALRLYKSRDNSEKLFRGDKSYLGNKSMRVYTDDATGAKIFIEFVALILRNKLFTYLKSAVLKNERKYNFMTVPAAIRELEKIELVRGGDNAYRLDHAVTATQKAILSAFGLMPEYIDQQAKEISETIAKLEQAQTEKDNGKVIENQTSCWN
ncbi:MAG: transposase [Lentisphaeria bacterium]